MKIIEYKGQSIRSICEKLKLTRRQRNLFSVSDLPALVFNSHGVDEVVQNGNYILNRKGVIWILEYKARGWIKL